MKSGDYKLVFFLPVPDEGGRILLLDLELPDLARALGELGADVDRSPARGAAYDLIVAGSPETGVERGVFDRLKSLLGEGGFVAVLARNGRSVIGSAVPAGGVAYATIPDPRNPSVVVPVPDTRPLGFLLSHFPDFLGRRSAFVRRSVRFFVRCGIQGPFLKHCIVIFRRGGAGGREPGMLAAVRRAASAVLGARSLAVSIITRVEVETQAVLYFFFEEGRREPSIVAKIAADPARNDELRRELENLESVCAFLPEPLKNSVPAVRGSGEWRGRFFYLQHFSGGPMLPSSLNAGLLGFRRGRIAAGLDRAWDWLMRFQSATVSGSRRVDELGIREMLGRYRAVHGDDASERPCLEWMSLELERHAGRVVPECAAHGDLFAGNIILGRDGVKVIDWRYFRREKHVCFDVMTLVSTFGEDFERILAGTHWASGFFRERFGTFFARNALDGDLFTFLAAVTFLEMSVREHEETGVSRAKDAAWRRRIACLYGMRDRMRIVPRAAGVARG